MKTVAIIQARMGSERLPGKVLKDIAGKPMLEWVAHRVRQASLVDSLIIATTEEKKDDAVAALCQRLALSCFRGSTQDVLDRYYQAATKISANTIVRITADCPLIDPGLIDAVIAAHYKNQADYTSNSLVRTYPRGLDVEVITMPALTRAWIESTEAYQRVHVTPYLYYHPNIFRLFSVEGRHNYSHYRWTVDTQEDLQFIQALSTSFTGEIPPWKEIIAIVGNRADLVAINSHIQQKKLEDG